MSIKQGADRCGSSGPKKLGGVEDMPIWPMRNDHRKLTVGSLNGPGGGGRGNDECGGNNCLIVHVLLQSDIGVCPL